MPLAPSQDGALWTLAWRPEGRHGETAFAGAEGLAFHGEIFNATELARELGLAAQASLAHLLRAGWQRWSVDFLLRLDGVFALALREGEDLVLFRDASGLSSLYCHPGPRGQLAFATHLDTLLRLPGTQRRLARRSLHEYLRFMDIGAPHSIYEDVVVPLPGEVRRWSHHRLQAPSSLNPPYGAPPASFEDSVEALDALLQSSVKTRLATGVRPAAFLSGGIDSALLCAMAARIDAGTTAVTVGFDGAAYDETPVAGRIAAHLGMTHQVLRFGRQDYLRALDRLGCEMEQPMADPAAPATVLAFEHCRQRYDTILDGTGADEAVGAMPPRHLRLATGYASLLPGTARTGLARLLHAAPGLAGYAPIFDFEHPADTMIRWNSFTRCEVEDLCGEPVSFEHTRFYRTYGAYPRQAHFERYSALLNAMPSDRLSQGRLLTGANVRFPFCEVQTDRFLRQLRIDHRHFPGQPKRILRALLARYVPMPIWDAPKHGFSFPLHEFLSANDYQVVRRHLDEERWRTGNVLAKDKVAAVAREYVAGNRQLMFRVWALVVLGAWLERHELGH